MARYKHWGQRYDPISENICSEPACLNEGADYEDGRVKCARHLGNSLRLEVTGGPRMSTFRRVRQPN